METENDGLEDVFLFNWVIFWFRLLIFQVVSHFELLFSKSTPLRGKEKNVAEHIATEAAVDMVSLHFSSRIFHESQVVPRKIASIEITT